MKPCTCSLQAAAGMLGSSTPEIRISDVERTLDAAVLYVGEPTPSKAKPQSEKKSGIGAAIIAIGAVAIGAAFLKRRRR